MSELGSAINNFLSQEILKKHPTNRPWITNKIKLWIGKRQSAFFRQGKGSDAYRHWRNKVQGAIRTAKYNYYEKKVAEVEQVNPRNDGGKLKKLAGQDAKEEWHHQFLDNDKDIKLLANKINRPLSLSPPPPICISSVFVLSWDH